MLYVNNGSPKSYYLAKFFETFDADQGEIDKLMQWTGLRDSFYAEEYFGDIIEDEGGTRRVIEDDRSAVLYKDTKVGDIRYFWELDKPHKVIGNIYENPDLIKEDK